MAVLAPSRPVASSIEVPNFTMPARRRLVNSLATCVMSGAFIVAIIPLALIIWHVVAQGATVLNTEFFSYSMRNITGVGGGIFHALIGTVLITAGAAVISVPIGVLAAIYLVEYGGTSRMARVLTVLVDVMTGIPSIVAGLFAYALFAMVFGPGVRIGIGGSVALTVLMVPVVVRASEEMLRIVPHELRESAYALGVPQWRTIIKVVIPSAVSGLIAGITLAIARVIGETAPLLLIAGATTSVNWNLFDGRMQTLPVFAFSQQSSPGMFPEAALDRAWGTALVLMLLVLAVNLGGRAIAWLFSPKGEMS